jgi:hypothetical protein
MVCSCLLIAAMGKEKSKRGRCWCCGWFGGQRLGRRRWIASVLASLVEDKEQRERGLEVASTNTCW